ncbi:MAG: aldo/keto reductase [Acidobacteria bacterium]|nr:aldo/keto reductase [Acidobacteriota bacterium]MCA1627486.1 aldo/keto reductase [Acidobacteriota bacterium]
MTVANHATPEGTARYRERFADRAAKNHFRERENLQLSSIGIGTYLGNPDEETDVRYCDAVVRAVQLGVNVIDSAANYRFQRSERSIGDALKTLTTEHDFARDELLLCTKGGYLPFDGAPPRDVRAYVEETFVRPGIASFDDFVGGSHCMTPAYLQHQLDQSLRNMGVATVDVYYIHNPESQLGAVSETEFYDRLQRAFERLEQNRSDGKLRYYGVATWNGFRAAPESGQQHSLERMVQLAREAGGEGHGFCFIQLPFNLAMPEAFSVAQDAMDFGVTVVASASMLQARLARGLPDQVRAPLGSLKTDAQTAIQFVRSTPGITTALVGMSRVEHVEENLALIQVEPVSEESFSQLFS